jgi:hypothetical protein
MNKITTIGEENIEKIENMVIAMLEHGSINIYESAMLEVPKKMIEMYDGALKEIENIINETIRRERR